jgi:hypothetical protein
MRPPDGAVHTATAPQPSCDGPSTAPHLCWLASKDGGCPHATSNGSTNSTRSATPDVDYEFAPWTRRRRCAGLPVADPASDVGDVAGQAVTDDQFDPPAVARSTRVSAE